MDVYKVRYIKECEHIRDIEANSKEEAIEKFYNGQCIKDYEEVCIGEEIIKIEF